jgi:hypothetical protein
MVLELMRWEFVDRREDVHLIGRSGRLDREARR